MVTRKYQAVDQNTWIQPPLLQKGGSSAKTERESRIPEVVRKASTPRVLDCREFLYLDFREFLDLDFRHIEVLELLFWFIVIECTDC